MNRRQFIFSTLAAVPALHTLDALASQPDEPYDLAIVKGADIAANVQTAVNALGGIGQFVKPGNVVFLKPNMSFPNPPEWGSTTHPELIRAVAVLCASAGAKRIVVSDFPMSRAALCFERSGMTKLASECRDFTFVELKDEAQFERVEVPDGQEVKELLLPRLLGKADVFINLPTAKAHSSTGVSFGLKNLMGLFWDRSRFHRDFDLHNAIVDLATVLKPQLTILDGMHLLLTNGPQGPGKVESARTIIAGRSMLAVDAAGCGLGAWNGRATAPQQIAHLARAAERGLGTLDISKLRLHRAG